MKFRFAITLTFLCATTLADSAESEFASFEQAYRAIKQGTIQNIPEDLQNHVLAPYLAHALLARTGANDQNARLDFLKRYPDGPLAQGVASRLLQTFASAGQHQNVLALKRYASNQATRCLVLQSEIAQTKTTTEELKDAVLATWNHAGSLPSECDPVIHWAFHQQLLSTNWIEARIAKVFEQGHLNLVGYLAKRLDKDGQLAYQRAVALSTDPVKTRRVIKTWPDNAVHRRAVSLALARVARRDHAWAATLWREASAHFKFDATDRARILDPIALHRANDYESDAATWLDLLGEGEDSAATREWRVREALSRRDWTAADRALARLDAIQRDDPRWRYWRAYVDSELKRSDAAALGFRLLSESPTFFGFLAADRSGAPYALCPEDAPDRNAAARRLATHSGILRALALHRLGWRAEARREWDHALPALDRADRIAAVTLAHAQGWFDRAPFALNKPEDLRLYALRFPNAYTDLIVANAKDKHVRPSFAAGVMRAESALVEDALSGANAYGLMQLIPSTAKRLAKQAGFALANNRTLFEPAINIQLGTRYLDELLDKQDHAEYAVLAAYNAGPSRLVSWRQQRGQLPTELFIETIPFRETREYIARVLSFDLIYDWRLNGDVLPLSERLKAKPNGPPATRKSVQCLLGSASTPVAKP